MHEKPYENALVVECGLQQIPVVQQASFDVVYKRVKVGEYIPDLICFGQAVVDTKTIDRITDHELGRMLNYLKITGLEVGLMLNFKRPRLEWKRVVLQNNRHKRAATELTANERQYANQALSTPIPIPY